MPSNAIAAWVVHAAETARFRVMGLKMNVASIHGRLSPAGFILAACSPGVDA